MKDRVRELEEEIVSLRIENETLKKQLSYITSHRINETESKGLIQGSENETSVSLEEISGNSISIMLLIDPSNGKIIDANDLALNFYGYTKSQIKNMNISDINILSKYEIQKEMKRASRSTKNLFYFNHKLSNGDLRNVLVISDLINVHGRNLLFSRIFDITDSNRKSKKLIESENKFKHMFNNINDMILVFTIDKYGNIRNFVEANEAACYLLGYTYEEILKLSPVYIEKRENNTLKNLVKLIIKNKYGTFQTKFITKKRNYIPVEINAHYFELNDEINILMVAKDISKRKEIEYALKNSIKQQEKLLSALPAAIFIVDKNKILSVNEYGKNLLGYDSCDELLGKDYLQFVVHPDYHDKVKARNKIKTIDAPLIEEKYIKKNGEVVDVEVTALKIPYENGSALLIFATNITEWKTMQNELIEMSQVEKLRTEFFANLSHELRTPLNVILGSLQLQEFYLKNERMGINTDKYKKIHERTKRNCYRLLRLVNNLIDITRIDSGFYEVGFQNYDIVHLIKTIVKAIEDYVVKKNLNIQFNTNVDSLIIACDPEKIERIMLNLLSNSIKFTEPKGHIKVEINTTEQEAIIVVKDSGIGIPKEKQDIIFERFVQVDKSLTRRHEGSGIGLSLVKSLVELHNGSISVISAVKEGSEFIIKLPNRTDIISNEEYKINSYDSFNIERMHIEFSDIYSK
ncbi:PAS domain S-box protein [Serpentinicella alkaliphila]|uniref:histidine kinase n=1 Tax=Serpentinicella alkaliphila TaxID=1734049 RepID=A0A4R2T0E4_9FIRM|nr:PAS domain S-box protein [Serpentinicella alkaliphila]QUH25568.1 PAS domain S-box protein [Serpentinicella alkaliphila]TCP94751.1 PAS domain S-box-containing protein [Serpentinicella alkaliphila]